MSDQDITTVGFCVVIFTGQYFKARIAKGCIVCVLTWCSGGYIRRCFRVIGALIHIISRLQNGITFFCCQNRKPGVIPLDQCIITTRSAQKQASLAARLDQSLILACFADAFSQFQTSTNFFFAAIGDVIPTGRSFFDQYPVQDFSGDLGFPAFKQLAAMIEVNDLKVSGNFTANQTQRVVLLGKPCFHLKLGRESFLICFPAADSGIFLFL